MTVQMYVDVVNAVSRLPSVSSFVGFCDDAVEREEGGDDEEHEGAEVDDDQPGDRRRERADESEPGMAREGATEPPRRARSRAGRRRGSDGCRTHRGRIDRNGRRLSHRGRAQLRSSLQAFTHSVYGTHATSVRPSRHSSVAVVQYQTSVQ